MKIRKKKNRTSGGSLLQSFNESIALLDRRSKRNVFFVSGIQSFLSLLDLAGVALMGVLAAVSVKGIQSQSVTGKTSTVLKILNLDSFSFQGQVAILTAIATFLLVLRTVLSVYFTRRILFFLSAKSGTISAELFERIMLDSKFLTRSHSTQQVLYSITAGVQAIMVGIIGAVLTLFSDLFLLVLITIGLFIVDPIMAISTVCIFSLISVVLYRLLYRRAKRLGLENSKLAITSNETILEAMYAYRESRVRSRTGFYVSEISDQRMGLSRITAEMSFMPNISKYVLEISVIVGAVLIAAIQFITQDAMQAISTLLVFLAAGTRVAPAILRAQQGAVQIRASIGTASPTFDLISEIPTLESRELKIPSFSTDHSGFVPQIEISNLCFKYAPESDFALRDIDLSINPGEVIALVGSSGSGKTTLVDLILGLLPTGSGSILISGETPEESVQRWPGAIAYVPQNVFIANGSIRRNISLGFNAGAATDAHYWNCVELSKLKDMVINLPNRLDSQVGENGSMLSGGQRQRLGIARALFTSPKLIVLDEATSALDGQTELDISDAIMRLRGSTTVILIAHRLASVRSADRVVYLDNGRIVAIGTFQEVRESVPNFDSQAKLMGL